MRPISGWLAAMMMAGAAICCAQQTRTPVVLELFTSEGCSSCPPADKLLATLDKEQPIAGAELIVMSEHVDYWNGDGWTDPFSSAAFTKRQQRYAKLLHVDDIYTPQLVVDGAEQVVGSRAPQVKEAIERAQRKEKAGVQIGLSGAGAKTNVAVKIAPDQRAAKGDVYVALAADHTETEVRGGENGGHKLSHVAVVYELNKIGKLSAHGGFTGTLEIPEVGKWNAATRVIVFVQDPASGKILAAGTVNTAKGA